MQNKKLIVLIILGMGAIFSLIYGIVTPSKARRVASQRSPDIRKQPVPAVENVDAPAVGGSRRTSFSDWGRDPFSSGPAASAPANVFDMVLTGILWDDSSPLAMIDDNPVAAGDKIGDYTVVEIKKDRVILNDGTKDFELILPSY